MGCNCQKQKIERATYDNVRKLARAFASSEKTTVAIYKDPDQTYGFIQTDCPEFQTVLPRVCEYIPAL